jgi:sugar phosphate isomerase/epimerase
MRLLASTGPMFGRPLDWTLGVIAEAGYDGAELMVTQDPVTQDADRAGAVADAEGLPLPVVHGPFLLLTRRVLGTDPIAKARRAIGIAAGLGADLMIVHPPYRWQGGFHRWLSADADHEAAAASTRVGVENLFPIAVGRRDVRFHRYVRPEDLEPFPHVVLDTSHLGVAGIDPVAALERLGERVVHLHVSDHRGGTSDSHAPLGAGRLPLARLLARVGERHRSGGAGSITLEVDCRPHLDDRARLVGFLAGQRRKAEALLGGASAEDVLGRPDVVPGDRRTSRGG